MYTCFACKAQFAEIRMLCHHLRTMCFLALNKTIFHCGEQGCFRHYTCLKSLTKHLNDCHSPIESSTSTVLAVCNDETTAFNDDIVSSSENLQRSFSIEYIHGNETLEINTHDELLSSPSTAVTSLENAERALVHDLSLFVASLYANPVIPRSTVQVVVEGVQSLLKNSLDKTFRLHLRELASSGLVNEKATSVIMQTLNLLTTSFDGLRSEHKRIDNFAKCGTYIYPVQITVGQRMELKRTSFGPSYTSVNCTMQLIPLRQILRKFLQLPNVLKETLSYMTDLKNTSNSDPVTNFVQGRVWKNMECNRSSTSDVTMPYLLYYDDFEVGNPLGSHAGVHKIGGVYVSLPFLPPRYSSQLTNIFVVGLFHSSDRVKFGNTIIFQKIIDEINYISDTGIVVDTDVYKGTIKFRLGAITGDNLGLHSMLGFVECFSANHPCRICTASKEAIRSMCYEDQASMRDMSNYNTHLSLNDVSQSGIKEKCVWLNVKGFDLFDNVAVDLLHDLLEGVCAEVMKFVIAELLKAKLIHLKTLTNRMFAFDYGPDSSSKPSSTGLQLDGSRLKIRTSASEMSVFVRYFGLLVGYYIPRGYDIWNLYVLLRKIMQKLYSVQIYSDSNEQLKHLIAEFNLLYVTLSKKNLTPKFHFLVHYPEMLKKFGPLTRMWTMRFEAKHRVAKIAARSSASRVNITKTIATKIQLQLNHIFLKNEPLSSIEYGKRRTLKKTKILELNLNFGLSEENYIESSLSWAKLDGVLFREDSVIAVDLSESTSLPSFAIITNIYVDNIKQVLFSCLSLRTIDFDEHFFAYEFETTNINLYIPYSKIVAPVTNTITIMPDLTRFVTLRWSFD